VGQATTSGATTTTAAAATLEVDSQGILELGFGAVGLLVEVLEVGRQEFDLHPASAVQIRDKLVGELARVGPEPEEEIVLPGASSCHVHPYCRLRALAMSLSAIQAGCSPDLSPSGSGTAMRALLSGSRGPSERFSSTAAHHGSSPSTSSQRYSGGSLPSASSRAN
jgi:hypothetical protein